MNEQALQDAYDLFVSNGYSDSIDDFKKLISTNPQALNDSYDLFSSNGYSDSIDDYKVLLGIGTKPTSTPVKKKFALESSSEDGSLESKKSIKPLSDMPTLDQQGLEQAMAKRQSVPTDMSGTPIVDTKAQKAAKPIIEKISKNKPQLIKPRVLKEQEEKESYLENLGTNVMASVNDVDKIIASIPETVYGFFSMPQNLVAYLTGLDISTSADKFKKNVGITNPVLDYYKEEGKKLEKEITDFNKDRYESSSIYDNIENGNYGDAFELLGSGIARSAPMSIAMMAGGATLSASELAAASTAAFYNQNLEEIQEENPNASEIENNIKALGMAAAEGVFSSIGEGQIGAVYKDIIKREGVEAGQQVFKDGLIQMYKGALEKYGVPVGLLGEGIEESATQITQNMISGKPAFEGAADAFILGGGSGVMFTAPISLKNAKDKIKNKIIEVDDKKKINTILADSNETFNKVFDVPKDSEINEKQLSIASLDKSRDLLVKDLKVSVKKGDMTEDQAKQSLYVFDKTQQITGQLRGIDIDDKSKVKVANLLKERETLSDKINGKDPALSILEKQRIDEINKEIQDTILKSKENAIQEQSTTEIPVQSETGVSEEVEGGTPEAKPEVITEPSAQGEVTQTIIEEPAVKIADALSDTSGVFIYDGKKGQLTTIGQTVVLETPTEIIDLGNVDELADSTLDDFGIQKEEELNIQLNEDNSINLNGKTYLNNYSNPDAAINQDKDGNYSVTLDTEDGQKRTFRGQQADQIVYQMKLKNFEQNGTDEQIEQANELADEAIRIEEEIGEPSTEREGKTVRKGKRKQRTLKTIKEPLTKAEREALQPEVTEQVTQEEAPVITNLEERISELEKEKSDISEQLTIYERFPQPKAQLKATKRLDEINKELESISPKKENNANITNNFDEINRSENKSLGGETIEFSFEGSDGNIHKVKGVADDSKGYFGLIQIDGNSSSKFISEAKDYYRNLKQQKIDAETTDSKTKENLRQGIIKEIENDLELNERIYNQADEDISVEYYESLSRALTRKEIDAEIATIPQKKAQLKKEYEAKKAELEEKLERAKGGKETKQKQNISKQDKEISETNKDADYYKNKITELEKEKQSLTSKALKQFPNSKIQLQTRARIDEINRNLKELGVEYKKALTKIDRLLSKKESKPTEAKDLLDLDTKDKDSLKRVFDYLDGIDKSLDMDPNELNDVTRVMAIGTAKLIVKTLKTLVNAGITLKEAIDKVAEIYSIKSSEIIDALDIASKINENVSEGISEMEAPGYNNLSKEIDNMISNDSSVSEVLDYVQSSDVYENATDVQKELLVRDVRKRFGLKEKAAPSVNKLFGKIKDITKVTLNEKTALKKQIRDVARGARDAVKSWKLASQQLGKEIKELKASGKITANQAANIISAFSKVNVFSGKSVDRFTNYMTKVFENADYAAKIKDAKTLRSNIKKLSKNKDKNANLRAVASQFVKIDPSLVEDINAYNEMASKIKEAITGSTVRGQKVKFAETTNIQEATDYISETLKDQEQKIREEMIAELQDLMGVDASEFSAEEMLALLEPEAKTNKYNEGIVRATIKKAFDVYSTMIKESISSGKDVFTDEDVEYTKSQKDIIKRFMEMDTDKMNVKDSLEAVDALSNFLTNQSTAKMEAVIRKYTGQQNAAKIASQNIFAVPLKKLGSKIFGRFLGEQTTNLNILFEKMFVGFNRAGKVKDAMGLTDLVNGKSKAQRETSTIVDNYVSKFYNKLANNQKFNTLFNNIERGMTSFMSRNIIGTEAEMQSEFDRRKKLIEESIDVLSNGNEQERKKALVYQEVYDKILNDSTNIDEVQSKTDPTNLEAVDFWIKEWDNKFDELSDTSLNIYNKVLDKDLNYTPDRFTRMSYDGGSVDLANTDSAFINNTNGNLYKKETGVLMEASRPEELPKNADSNEAESYIDLSFDKNNSNSMYDALVDINTAGPIRQVEAFMNTADFRKIFGEDADLIKGKKSNIGRIQQYIQNIRNKNPYSNDEFAKAMRGLNKIASLGVGQALAGPLQPIKQVVPVALNTLVNTKGNLDTSAMSNKDFMDWLNQSGYAVANRGVESLAEIDSINKMIEEASKSKGAKLLNLLEEANKKWLKLFLVKPDVWIAISSWKSYYEQSLRDQGEDTKDIDYSSHEINKEAADYAQRMVDRQQNISDTDMSGTMFSNKNPYAQTMVKIFMPFASFRMNQGSRLGSDLRVLSNWSVSTAEDKKIAARSLSGYAVEMATFKLLSAGIAIGIASLTASLMGRGEDEEEKKKRRDNLKKGAITSTITDIVSPIPVLDKLVQNRSADVLSGVQDVLGVSEEDKVSLYESKKQNFVEGLGTLGIAFTRGEEIWELLSLSVTGKYEDNYGKTKEISEENRKALSDLVGPVLLSNLTGFASPEVSSVSRNAVKIAKKKYLTDEEKSAKEEKAYEKEENLNQKERALKQVMDKYPSEDVREAAKDLLNDLNVESKEDEQQLKEERALERENKKALLVDPRTGTTYDNESELKRYNPVLWKKNFGPYSEWSKTHNAEKRAKKAMNKEIRKEEDKEYKYFKRSSKTKKNRDGTTRRSSKYSYTKTKGDGSTVKITRSTSSD